MRLIMITLIATVFTTLLTLPSLAEEYPVFDGRKYNGLYYPRIDVVEWGTPEYMVFNIYSKDKPIDVSAKVIKRGANKVLLFAYDLSYRGERRCRSVLAPKHFKVGQELHFHVDRSPKDLDQIYVSSTPMKKPIYSAKPYGDCKDIKAISQRKKEKKKPVKPEPKREIASPEMPTWFDEKPTDQKNYDWFGETPGTGKKKSYFFD